MTQDIDKLVADEDLLDQAVAFAEMWGTEENWQHVRSAYVNAILRERKQAAEVLTSLAKRLEEAEAERAEQWRQRREAEGSRDACKAANDTLRAELEAVKAERDELQDMYLKQGLSAFEPYKEQKARAAQLEAENGRLLEEVKRLKTPDNYWDWDDPESGYDNFQEPVQNADMGAVVRLLTGKTLGTVWATTRVLTVDENGDWDDSEIVCFDTKEEAERCWPESLEVARAALTGREG